MADAVKARNGTEALVLEIAGDALTIGDLEVLELWMHGEERMTPALDVLARAANVDVRTLRLAQLREIVAQVLEAATDSVAEKNSEGG